MASEQIINKENAKDFCKRTSWTKLK